MWDGVVKPRERRLGDAALLTSIQGNTHQRPQACAAEKNARPISFASPLCGSPSSSLSEIDAARAARRAVDVTALQAESDITPSLCAGCFALCACMRSSSLSGSGDNAAEASGGTSSPCRVSSAPVSPAPDVADGLQVAGLFWSRRKRQHAGKSIHWLLFLWC